MKAHVFFRGRMLRGVLVLCLLGLPVFAERAFGAWSLTITNGYGDTYRMNLMRNRTNYEAYKGSCSYRGFSLSGCSTTGEVIMLRIKETSTMPEHLSILSTSMRYGTTQYVLNDMFHWVSSSVMAGYENWYPFDMSCSVAMYINSGGFSLSKGFPNADPLGGQGLLSAGLSQQESMPTFRTPFAMIGLESDPVLDLTKHYESPKAYSLVMTNGYGDTYRMNLMRDRTNYQAYRGVCSYRGFSLSGCSTTGEVVMLRIFETSTMPEHFSIVSTSMRWGTTMYFLNDVFHWVSSSVMAGYENWYPFDMSCSVAMYINSGGLSLKGPSAGPKADRSIPFDATRGTGTTNVIGVLIPLTGDLEDMGLSYQAAHNIALGEITNTAGMPAIQLEIKDTSTDASVAAAMLAELYEEGVRIVLGPETSEECAILLEYAEENNILLISSSATASQLAITNDNLMRLTIDDSQQARALAELIYDDGITDIAILSRSDMYGEGLQNAVITEFTSLGGTVFSTNWCSRVTDFIGETITNVGEIVATHLLSTSAEKVGFVAILFDEGVTVMENAASISALSSIRWYGTDGMAQNSSLLTNAAAASLAKQTRFVCSAFGSFTNELYGVVESNIQAQVGSAAVSRYPMSAYDALWLTALALKETGGTQTVDTLKTTIRSVATNYSGATGPIVFNGADDRSAGSYDIWTVSDASGSNAWVDIAETLPDAPANVSASDGTYSDKVRVSWNSISGSTGYELWRGTNDNAESGSLISELSVTSYDDLSAVVGQSFYYWVKAKNSLGTSAFSSSDLGYVGTSVTVINDYNGDGKSDLAVFDNNGGYWYVISATNSVIAWAQQWGWSGAAPVPGDYDNDGISDMAVFDSNTGYWYIRTVFGTVLAWNVQLGWPGAVPVWGDYNADGTSDLAVFDSSTGYWYVYSLSGSVIAWEVGWGWPGAVPVSGDYDGDGVSDIAVFDSNTGYWYVYSLSGSVIAWEVGWGWPGAVPVSGDYDGDGVSDIAIFDSNTGYWYIYSLSGSVIAWQKACGQPGAIPVGSLQ